MESDLRMCQAATTSLTHGECRERAVACAEIERL